MKGQSLHIKNELQQLTLLFEFIGQATEELALNQSTYMHLKLAVEEAVVNVILYAYPEEKDKDILINLDYNRKRLKVVITDYGIAFNPTEAKDPDITLPAEERPIGGLGTFCIKQLMTKVSYHRRGDKNVLTLIKEIH
jgi:anti-sigma regulatory factor (Ser/Thr protein kinase)